MDRIIDILLVPNHRTSRRIYPSDRVLKQSAEHDSMVPVRSATGGGLQGTMLGFISVAIEPAGDC